LQLQNKSKQLQAITSNCKQSQAITSNSKQLEAIASNCLQLQACRHAGVQAASMQANAGNC